LLVEQNLCGFILYAQQTLPHLALSDESFLLREIDSGFKVHEIFAICHGLCLLEVCTVRQVFNLVQRVIWVFRHSHGSVHFHLLRLQQVINLVHVLLEPPDFVAFDDVLIEGKDEFGKLVLSLLLESGPQYNLGKSPSVGNIDTGTVRDLRKSMIEGGAKSGFRCVVVGIAVAGRAIDVVDHTTLLCQHMCSPQGVRTIRISIRVRVVTTVNAVRELIANMDNDLHRLLVPGESCSLCEPSRERFLVASTPSPKRRDVILDLSHIVGERLHERRLPPVTHFVTEVSITNDGEADFFELSLGRDLPNNVMHLLFRSLEPGGHGSRTVDDEGKVKLRLFFRNQVRFSIGLQLEYLPSAATTVVWIQVEVVRRLYLVFFGVAEDIARAVVLALFRPLYAGSKPVAESYGGRCAESNQFEEVKVIITGKDLP